MDNTNIPNTTEENVARTPKTCANRKTNNFRCARDKNGYPRTPAADGGDCANCPNYVYTPSRDEEKARVADSDAKKGAAIGSAVLIVSAIIAAIALIAITALIRSCAG